MLSSLLYSLPHHMLPHSEPFERAVLPKWASQQYMPWNGQNSQYNDRQKHEDNTNESTVNSPPLALQSLHCICCWRVGAGACWHPEQLAAG